MPAMLSISLGTRVAGIAHFVNGDLRNWQIKTFRGVWSPEKHKLILYTFKRLIEIHTVATVVIKVPHERTPSGVSNLIVSIKAYCDKQGITLVIYTLDALKQKMKTEKRLNSQVLMQHVTDKYPEVFSLYHSKAKRTPYYLKLFEAICAGMCCLQDVSKKTK